MFIQHEICDNQEDACITCFKHFVPALSVNFMYVLNFYVTIDQSVLELCSVKNHLYTPSRTTILPAKCTDKPKFCISSPSVSSNRWVISFQIFVSTTSKTPIQLPHTSLLGTPSKKGRKWMCRSAHHRNDISPALEITWKEQLC